MLLVCAATDQPLTSTQPFPPDTHFPMGSRGCWPGGLARAGDPRADTQAVRTDAGPPTPPAGIPAATVRQLSGGACGLRPSLVGPRPPLPRPPAPPPPPRRRTSYPASQQLVGRDPQRPPVDGVRVPGASIRVRLEHFWGCQRRDRENVTAPHSSHAPPVRAGTQGRGPQLLGPRSQRASCLPPLWAASRLENKGQSPQVLWGGRGGERPQRRSWRSVNHSARGASGLQTRVKTKIQTPEGMGNFGKRHCS